MRPNPRSPGCSAPPSAPPRRARCGRRCPARRSRYSRTSGPCRAGRGLGARTRRAQSRAVVSHFHGRGMRPPGVYIPMMIDLPCKTSIQNRLRAVKMAPPPMARRVGAARGRGSWTQRRSWPPSAPSACGRQRCARLASSPLARGWRWHYTTPRALICIGLIRTDDHGDDSHYHRWSHSSVRSHECVRVTHSLPSLCDTLMGVIAPAFPAANSHRP
jgi:hypothetical protein